MQHHNIQKHKTTITTTQQQRQKCSLWTNKIFLTSTSSQRISDVILEMCSCRCDRSGFKKQNLSCSCSCNSEPIIIATAENMILLCVREDPLLRPVPKSSIICRCLYLLLFISIILHDLRVLISSTIYKEHKNKVLETVRIWGGGGREKGSPDGWSGGEREEEREKGSPDG